ncbi:MAG: Gfo/Idh/MocA family oxidoreductase [Hymenobacteraceae bacterium]|nr:Gfo/Idh/MocA family oxidoreductase [Hymenobacteraceae bacterium]
MASPVGVALLSFGLSGQVFHAPFLQRSAGFRLLGAWERSTARIAAAYPGTRRYATLGELLADPAVELVIVNTPIPTHFAYARQALLAGKHVVVEKAFTTTVTEAEELAALARDRDRVLTVFQNRRWDSDFRAVQQVLASGELGPLVEAELRFDRFRPALGTKAAVETPGPGAGTLYDLGPHLIDQALTLFGWPQTVHAALRAVRAGSRVVDWVDICLTYSATETAAPDLRVQLRISPLAPPKVPAYQLFGQRGTFLKHRADPQEAALRANPGAPLGADWGTEPAAAAGQLYCTDPATGTALPPQSVPSPRGDYGMFYEALPRALTTSAPSPLAPAPDGIRVMRVLAAAEASHAAGQPVTP